MDISSRQFWRLLFHSISFVISEIFYAGLALFFPLLLLENWKHGFVTYFFNLNVLLCIILVSGIFTAAFPVLSLNGEKHGEKKNRKIRLIAVVLPAFVGGLLFFSKAQSFGTWGIVGWFFGIIFIVVLTMYSMLWAEISVFNNYQDIPRHKR